MSKIKSFVEDNGISFSEGVRNTSVTTLIGLSLYLGLSEDDLRIALANEIEADGFISDEITRLWNYCKSNNYGKWWESVAAKELYKF